MILRELELIDRANNEIMDAKGKEDDDWDYEDFKLLLCYAEVDIESVDVRTIAAQEAINIEISRKVYDRISANSIPPAVVAPDRVASELGREDRRDVRDSLRRSNAAKIAFRQFWDRNRVVDIGEIDCMGTLKALEKDLENLLHKCDRYTEEAGDEMDDMTLNGYLGGR